MKYFLGPALALALSSQALATQDPNYREMTVAEFYSTTTAAEQWDLFLPTVELLDLQAIGFHTCMMTASRIQESKDQPLPDIVWECARFTSVKRRR